MSNGYPANNVYIGARYVPKLVGEWDGTKETAYEPLIIVTYQGNSYTSRQYVPTGIDISNTEYWVPTGNFNGQIESFRLALEALKNDAELFTATFNSLSDMLTYDGDAMFLHTLNSTPDDSLGLYYLPYAGEASADEGSIVTLNNGKKVAAVMPYEVYPEYFSITDSDSPELTNTKWDAYTNYVNTHNACYKFLPRKYGIYKPLHIKRSMHGAEGLRDYPDKQTTIYAKGGSFANVSDTIVTYNERKLNKSALVCFYDINSQDTPLTWTIQDIQFFGYVPPYTDSKNYPCDYCVWIADAYRMTFKNVSISGAKVADLKLEYTWMDNFTNLLVNQTAVSGIEIGDLDASTTTTLLFSNCYINSYASKNNSHAIHILNADDVTFNACAFDRTNNNIPIISKKSEGTLSVINSHFERISADCAVSVTKGVATIINPAISGTKLTTIVRNAASAVLINPKVYNIETYDNTITEPTGKTIVLAASGTNYGSGASSCIVIQNDGAGIATGGVLKKFVIES